MADLLEVVKTISGEFAVELKHLRDEIRIDHEVLIQSVKKMGENIDMFQEVISSLPVPKDGVDGRSVTVDEVVDELLSKHLALLKGADGQPVELDDVVNELVSKYAYALKGADGKDGLNGADGNDGLNGKDADNSEITKQLISDSEFIDRIKQITTSHPWQPGIYREGALVKHYVGREYQALEDTNEEPGDSLKWVRIGTHGLRDTGGYKSDHQYEPGDIYHKDGSAFFCDGANHRLFAAKPFTKAEFDKESKKIQDSVSKNNDQYLDSKQSISDLEYVLTQNKSVIEEQGVRIKNLEETISILMIKLDDLSNGKVKN